MQLISGLEICLFNKGPDMSQAIGSIASSMNTLDILLTIQKKITEYMYNYLYL